MNKDTIVVGSCSIAALFSGQALDANDGEEEYEVTGKLTIPEYQRPYTWGVAEVTRLIDDLIEYFDVEEQPKHHYYLGSIILHEKNDKLNIIDGQQRLTTLGILCYLLDHKIKPDKRYSAPTSQLHIAQRLKQFTDPENIQNKALIKQLKAIGFDLNRLNVTLVVTLSEDDAYRFFETQNTGGVRLNGPDIIKAHHLRQTDKSLQNHHAKQWEAMDDIAPLIDNLLQVRHWQALNFRELPSHRQAQLVKKAIVAELAENCLKEPQDVAYRLSKVVRSGDGMISLLGRNRSN